MARRKIKRTEEEEDEFLYDDEPEYSDDDFHEEEPKVRKRSQAEIKEQRARKRRDNMVLIIAVILIVLTSSGYIYYAYAINPTLVDDESEDIVTGNQTGSLFVISDITHNWTKESWHIMNINGKTNFLLKVENNGDNEEYFRLSDTNDMELIKITYNINNLQIKPGKSNVVIVQVTNSMKTETRIPNPIEIQLKSKATKTLLDSVQIFLTIEKLNENEIAEKGDKVSAYYTGSFENGTLFDYSLKDPSNTNPLYISLSNNIQMDSFNTNQYATVIPGFKKGIIGMIPGETHIAMVPPELGYEPGQPLSGVTLIFEIRLLSNDRDL
jgi:FKBP-type peptidyl-prolyl cis-trans isomerase